ncbi:extracellular solute-binding protein [Lacticaseibacillus mingshuiensis]|uniref:extracellular solute-binding protein n=1 Tax=Lacticaseibacillus mingshuiensis TaxID=2799574 RepID=UPI001CECAD77|nr:extracellular solute-binding protein [Lacticaseibacillus mingshuiensis]
MMLKRTKFLAAGMILFSSAFTLTACGSTSAATKEDPKTISLIAPDHSDVHPKTQNLWMWKEYEKMSGVHVNWETMKDLDQKKQLILNRKTLPDGLYQTNWSNDELTKYGSQGLFQPLEKLIPKYAPNLNKLMEEDPSIKKAITSSNGHIYGLPYMSTDPLGGGRHFKLYINKKWLDKLGLKKPTNTTELENVLEQFVTKDPNGNGKADEQGFYMDSGNFGSFELMIKSAFGFNTAGRTAMEAGFYIDDKDQLQYIYSDPKMQDAWKYLAELYKKGLIAKTAFAGVDHDKWIADGSKEVVGCYAWVGQEMSFGEKVGNEYVPISVLSDADGKNGATVTQSGVMGTSAFIITKAASEAKAKQMLKWVDYFYSKEGSDFGYFGKEGVTYNVNKDGNKVFVDKILNDPKGASLGAYQYVDNVYGGFYPYLEVEERLKNIGKGMAPEVFTDDPLSHMPKQVLPNLQGTTEESAEIASIQTDLNNYVDQARVKFVTGKWNLDTQWDSYVAQLKKIGLDKWLEIRRAQYKRYEED